MARGLYEILGVPESADEKAIKSAYKKLAKKYHPDINKDPDAGERMKEINKAYEILKDPKKRALYDEYGEKAIEADFNEDILNSYKYSWSNQNSSGPFGPGADWPFGFDDDFLSSMFGGGGGGGFGGFSGFGNTGGFHQSYQQRPTKGEDLNADISIDFMKAVKGGDESVSFMVNDGTGQHPVTYDIKIPEGIRDGQKIRLAGKGAPGINGGQPGDLLLKVNIRPDSVFTRDGDDLNVTIPVDFTDALLGAEVDVPTLDGTVSLKIPAGTQPDQRFRLRGKGVKSSRGVGDEYAKIKVTLPKDLSDEQKDLITKFKESRA